MLSFPFLSGDGTNSTQVGINVPSSILIHGEYNYFTAVITGGNSYPSHSWWKYGYTNSDYVSEDLVNSGFLSQNTKLTINKTLLSQYNYFGLHMIGLNYLTGRIVFSKS